MLARVEGEGALEVDIEQGRIEALRLRIYEPPRYFEKFLEGRRAEEVPDLVARICGICPVAYQMSAVNALEAALGAAPGPWVQAMRRAMYCGEWLQSHSLHIHLLAAPDFLGYASVLEMAAEHGEAVRRGLRLQALGNDLIRLFGARSVHPVGVRLGGFHCAPPESEVAALAERLEAARAEAEALVLWAAGLELPEREQDFTCVALSAGDAYPMESGARLISDAGLDIDIAAFEQHVRELQVPHSTALHALLEGHDYLVGPLARLNLHHARLPERVRATLARSGLRLPSRNMFHSVVARALEVQLAVEEAVRLLRDYRTPPRPYAEVRVRAGEGVGASEAPRGVLWHRYAVDAAGLIAGARIVPPTSQNQARIEADLRGELERFGLDRPDAEIARRGETVIRNYDPCISCATHFLRLQVRRR